MNQNNNLIWVLLRSIFIVLGISTLCGACVGFITHSIINGALTTVAVIVLQFALNEIISTLAARKNKDADFLAQQVLREASERQLPFDLNCAYCNTLNRVGISFNSENIFTCTQCQQLNKAYIQFSVVRVSTPLTPREDVSKFIDMGDDDIGVMQSTLNKPIKLNEK
jgi:hypothetical protein